ncbi:MAG: alcohol dehydrogenase catalytic domain-containing protein [Candidatus Promineifilaceae bacterium]
MQALYLSDNGLQLLSDYAQPQPAADEALIRVLCAGICSTDLEIVRGYGAHRGVLGHEFVGVVESAADTDWIGRRVVGGINLGCQQCTICTQAGPEHCPQRRVLGILHKDGVFAEYVTLPLTNLMPVPANVPDEMAVFTEPLAAALRITEQLALTPGMAVAVVGPGRLGMLIGQTLALTGAVVTMLGRRESSLKLPAAMGMTTALVTGAADNSFDVVVEATGNDQGLVQALRLVRPLGTLILKSTYAGSVTLSLTKIVVDEIKVIGSRCGPFAPALRLLSRRQITVEPLIDGRYSLADGLAAMAHAAQPGVRKILLRP